MPVFEKPFSSLPEGENFNPASDYVIVYHRSSGVYACTNISSNLLVHSGDSLYFYSPDSNYFYNYDSSTRTWSDSGLHNTFLDLSLCDFVYSTTDLYVDNSLYFSTSANNYGSVISDTVSSSTILTTLKNGVLPLLSVVLIAVVGILTFRKAFSFVRSSVKGA